VGKLSPSPDYLLIDGLRMNGLVDIPRESIVRGDSKSISIAAASIVAKVWRDRLMVREDGRFPLYGFSRHKGYGTGYHHLMLMKHGLCEIHRRSFEPMRSLEGNLR
jgi:ribonuclease HII